MQQDELVDDIYWQEDLRCCGAQVVVESQEKITPEILIENGLDNSVDAAYVFVNKKQTNSFAAYYLERGINGITCALISDSLNDEQVARLTGRPELVKGKKGERKHLFEPISGGWCTNNKDKVAILKSPTLDTFSEVLNPYSQYSLH